MVLRGSENEHLTMARLSHIVSVSFLGFLIMQKITISGGFHNRPAITIHLSGNALSTGQYRKIIRHMCGIKGCSCSIWHGWDVSGIDLHSLSELLSNAQYTAWQRRSGARY